MFFNKRNRYNGDVAALLPALGIDMQDAGVFKLLNTLDMAWAQQFNVYEAALLIAYSFAGGLYKHGHAERADALLKDRLVPIQDDWIKKGIVRTELVRPWPEKLAEQAAAFRPPAASADSAPRPFTPRSIEEKSETRRNELCPCGSRQKYKHCCGRLR